MKLYGPVILGFGASIVFGVIYDFSWFILATQVFSALTLIGLLRLLRWKEYI